MNLQGHQGSINNCISHKPNINQKLSPTNSLQAYIIGKTLGEGNFGKVRIALHKQTSENVAIKIIDKSRLKELKEIERVNREIHILKILKHPNIIQLYEIIESPKYLFLIMEIAEGGELFNHIIKNKKLAEPIACRLFQQIINGVEYIHQQQIVHRDLKPENLLLDKHNNIKIVDFGLSNVYTKDEELKTACGSPCYAAPEMISGFKYCGLKVDLWSCGVILYAMLCGNLPFEDNDTSGLYKKITSGSCKFPSHMSFEAKDLLKNILNVDPNKRFTISDIRNHVWFSIHPMDNTRKEEGFGGQQINYEVFREMKKNGLDSEYVLKCIDANISNSLTTTYFLLCKRHRNYYLRGRNPKNTSKSIHSQTKPKSKSPLGNLTPLEALKGLETILRTENNEESNFRYARHKKSNSLLVNAKRNPKNNTKNLITENNTSEENRYVTKINITTQFPNEQPKIKIPYLNRVLKNENPQIIHSKKIKEFFDSQLKYPLISINKEENLNNSYQIKNYFIKTPIKKKKHSEISVIPHIRNKSAQK